MKEDGRQKADDRSQRPEVSAAIGLKNG